MDCSIAKQLKGVVSFWVVVIENFLLKLAAKYLSWVRNKCVHCMAAGSANEAASSLELHGSDGDGFYPQPEYVSKRRRNSMK